MVNRILLGVGLLSATILTFILFAFVATNELTKTIDRQIFALNENDYRQAYAYTSSDFQNATPLDDFIRFTKHYPGLSDKHRIKILSREVKDSTGTVTGILEGENKEQIPIEFRLVKEDGEWKILGIQLTPKEVTHELVEKDVTFTSGPLPKVLDNSDSRYTIKFPADWEYERAGQGTIIISGKRGTPSYYSTVNIQTILTRQSGGDFTTVRQFMLDLRRQATQQSPNIKFLERGPFSIEDANGAKLTGEYAVFSYPFKGENFKQWQIVVLRKDGQVFYAWAYTSPNDQYDRDYKTAKQILDSWVIY